MQSVKFGSIDEFLEFLPEDEYLITASLRNLVFECIPDVKEKLSYQVPYYSRFKSICFIWPGAVFWGRTRQYEGVRFGFTSGHLLSDPNNYLVRDNRKYVCWKDFVDPVEIDPELLQMFLSEAAFLDEELAKAKGKKL
jgi:hypothetical protein